MNALLFPDLPYKDRDRLVSIQEISTSEITFENYQERMKHFNFFESIGGHRITVHYLTGNAEAKRIVGYYVTSGFLPTLGVQPLLGRLFLPHEDLPGAGLTVILSEELWRSSFFGDPNIIGKSIRMNGIQYEVIGVMPKNFRHPKYAGIGAPCWTTLGADPRRLAKSRAHYGVPFIARLKDGMTLEQAQSRVDAVRAELNIGSDFKLQVRPLENPGAGNEQFQESGFSIFFAAVLFVLLIACANITNLLLARGMTRQKEISVRIALGADRGRVIQQLLTETTLLCLIGGTLGFVLTFVFRDTLFRYSSQILWTLRESPINKNVALFTAGASLFSAFVTGLLPAVQTSRVDLHSSLKEGGQRSGLAGRGDQIRSFLVVLQVALSLVLLIGAGLMLKSFRQMQKIDLGYKPEGLLQLSVELPGYKYEEEALKENFYKNLLQRLEDLPQIQQTGITTRLPWDVGGVIRITADNGTESDQGIDYTEVSSDYLQTLGSTLLNGRYFVRQDERLPVVMINQTMARKFWPGKSIIGRTITLHFEEPKQYEIVGVIRDLNQSPDVPNESHIYLPFGQGFWRYLSIVTRSNLPKADALAAVKNVIRSVDPEVPIALEPALFTELLDELMLRKRMILALVSLFAGIAICLAVVGTYALVDYSANRKQHEIGVRISVGANRADILKMIFNYGMRLVVVGIVVGLLLCLAVNRILQTYLFGISSTDPATYVSISVLLILVALIACLIPARRAATMDPANILRSE